MSDAAILTPEDIRSSIADAFEKLSALGEIVIDIAFKGATSADLATIGRRAADARRNSAELGLDDVRSVLVEALTGQMPAGYANSTDLDRALTARIDENDIAAGLRPASPLLTAMRRADEAEMADAALVSAARARGASILAFDREPCGSYQAGCHTGAGV